MSSATQSPWKYVILWLRIYFGAHLFYSGARFILTSYVPEIPGPGGVYVEAAKGIYIFQIIKYMECVFGIMLLTNRGVLLALMLEMPATVNIFWLNTFIVATPRQLFTGPQELFMNGVLLLAYGGYFASALQAKVEPMWLWDGWKKLAGARTNGSATPTSVQRADA
ncbi:hypothetical protein HTY52_11500 [Cupriavidus taiwanensis]|uniref:hypothetical protein n=1 Tax=Cupriavidus taiwanensis TaxID=164546 RepID=UPI0015720E50|nr:hypothetical protein [Cupriavidus taiwanensis]NSX14696.1 hypothetical protein [Cupriavidus taiwanensis]